MKKLIIIFSTLCLIFAPLTAQLPKNRTTSTIIADALTQLPASDQAVYNQTLSALTSTGEEGLLELVQMMAPPEKKANAVIEYALSGWTNFVANKEPERMVAAKAYVKALSATDIPEVKAFIIAQLEKIGKEESIDVLLPFLQDKYLASPAAQALVAIKLSKADDVLLSVLQKGKPEFQMIMANAVGQTGNQQAEPFLLSMLKNKPSAEMETVLLFALSSCGTRSSLRPLEEKAKQAGYLYEKTGAVAAYTRLIEKLAAKGDAPEAIKAAEELLQRAIKAGNDQAGITALKILMSEKKINKTGLLKQIFKENDITYISSALDFYTPSVETKGLKFIVQQLSESTPELQEQIIYWLGNNNMKRQLSDILPFINSKDKKLQVAAIYSVQKIGGEDALKALSPLLSEKDKKILDLIKPALMSLSGDVPSAVVSEYDNFSPEGKRIALELLAARHATAQNAFVFRQVRSSDPSIQEAALKALKNVVTEKQLPELFRLLEQETRTGNIQDLQLAVKSAMSSYSTEKQLTIITKQMNQSPVSGHLYYPLLAVADTREFIDRVAKDYASTEGRLKDAAFMVLTKSKNFYVIYPLIDILKSSTDPEMASKSLQAVINLINTSNDQKGEVRALFLREIMPYAKNDAQKKQIIKLAGQTGTFQALNFIEPYLDVQELKEVTCQSIMSIVLDNKALAGDKTTRLLKRVMQEVNNPDAGYQRDAILKYLNENSQSGGYQPIFNGKNLWGWKGLVENPVVRSKMTKEELAKAQAKADEEIAASWKIENGELIFTGKGKNLCTDKVYGDFEMFVDWKLYPGDEPDAGIYLRGTPQVQIWDTARVKVGAQVGSGGLYNNKLNQDKPLKVADLKLGYWNTFHIKLIGERVTVYLNGELVVNNVIMENYWDRKQPLFSFGEIELQAHGSKVAYRDIYVKELVRPEPFKLSKEEVDEGYEVLFDGTDMHKWTGNTTDYVVEDGNIVIYPSKSFGGNLYTKDEFGNFVFRFEFQLTPGANNGLGIRTPMEGDAAYVGMELQILDNDAPIYSKLKEYQYHGSVYGIIPALRGYLKPVGEWNYQEVIANGDNIKITLNGTVILDGNLREATKDGPKDKKSHPGVLNEKGHIGFLGHGSVVKFRNIRIRKL
ncbi:MAG: family 16 glycoside hydrolase [Paludibacter sp.]|nr:family 16 glycoside hydrolase [Paludibacter sp.]